MLEYIKEFVIDGPRFENSNGDAIIIVDDAGRDQIMFVDGEDTSRYRIYTVYPDVSGNIQEVVLMVHRCDCAPLRFNITDSLIGNDISKLKARRNFHNHLNLDTMTNPKYGIVWKEAEKALTQLMFFCHTQYNVLIATNELAALRAL